MAMEGVGKAEGEGKGVMRGRGVGRGGGGGGGREEINSEITQINNSLQPLHQNTTCWAWWGGRGQGDYGGWGLGAI